jgi:signal transduction histidine kinase/CheY-like chemotaxis protein
MRFREGATALGLVVLLTWLLIRGLGPPDPATRAALRALNHYTATQSALHRDLLRARAGLLRNYDPIVAHLAAMDRDLQSIRDKLAEPATDRLLAPIMADLGDQERHAERFKSGNALLQNSLSYFGLFSSRIMHDPANDALARSVDALSGEMLHLTLDTSAATIADVGAKLRAVRIQCRRALCPADAESLMAHGRLLHDLLPKVDRRLAAIVGTDRSLAVERLRDHLQERIRAAESASVRFRLLLYGASLAFLFFLFKGEVRLRHRAADLRRQVALEHAVASLSARLIGGGALTTTLVQAGLVQLAQALGARRAYFHRGRSGIFCVWPPDSGAEAGKAAALRLAARVERGDGPIVHLRRGDRSLGPVEAALLRRLGATGWIGVLRSEESAADSLLAFDLDAGSGTRLPRQLTVLRTAFDAICLAFEHAEAEVERQRLAEQLAHARRMETIGAFASGIAHNFNNLIGAISGYAEMAQARVRDDTSRHHLDQIQLAAERGGSLVDGLLDYGRRRQQRRAPMDLRALVDETRDMAAAALTPSHAIAITHCDADAPVMIDPAQVQLVLLNLCRNAVQAMGRGGAIHIETDTLVLDEPLAHPHGPVAAGRYATVTVRDSGGGMPPAVLRRLFEPFYTTKANGNGLGLATARDIIADFGGAITIDSRPGSGTDARIWLPVLDAAAAAFAPADPPVHAKGNGELILLMAEERSSRLATEDLVAALGYEPIGVETPERLMEVVGKKDCAVDALLLCVSEVTEESWALLAEFRSRCPDAPRILAIGSAARLDAARLAAAGVSAIIQCPPGPRELSSALQRCLRRPLSAALCA